MDSMIRSVDEQIYFHMDMTELWRELKFPVETVQNDTFTGAVFPVDLR